MKKTALALLFLAVGLGSAAANDVIKDAMKKYHKPEDALCKKVGKGEATDADLAELLKVYTAMCGQTPGKGDKAKWVEKCQALIGAVKKVQAKDCFRCERLQKSRQLQGLPRHLQRQIITPHALRRFCAACAEPP
jgi:hypothetical protein